MKKKLNDIFIKVKEYISKLFSNNKPKQIELTPLEIKRKKSCNDLSESKQRLESKVIKAYILSQVLNVYPKCPDRDHDKRLLEEARESVHNEIAEYDLLRSICIQINKEADTNWPTPPDSHTIVYYALKQFLEK